MFVNLFNNPVMPSILAAIGLVFMYLMSQIGQILDQRVGRNFKTEQPTHAAALCYVASLGSGIEVIIMLVILGAWFTQFLA